MVISGVADDLFVSWFMMFSTKSFQSRPTYGDFLLFKMAAADILNFWNFSFLTIGTANEVELCHRPRFRRNRLNCGRDMGIFRFFKMVAAAILDFKNFKFLTVKRVKLHHYAKFRQNHSNRGRDFAIFRFSRWRPQPSWIFEWQGLGLGLLVVIVLMMMQVTSQHPYAEDFIGEPHVYTVDMNDKEAVERAVQMALTAFDNGQVDARKHTMSVDLWQSYYLTSVMFITGPPTHSVGGQTSNSCWCLSSSVGVCNTPRRACRRLHPSCHLRSNYISMAAWRASRVTSC